MTRIYAALQRHQEQIGASILEPRPAFAPTILPRRTLSALYHSIQARLPEGAEPILLFASACKGEGTSTIAADLAVVTAEDMGKRVLLVRVVRSLTRRLPGLNGGLEAALDGEARLEEVIARGPGPGLQQTTLTLDEQGGRQALNGAAIKTVLRAALNAADMVLIDVPPVLTDVAAVALSRHCGGAVLVVEAERTRAPLVQEARAMIEEQGCPVIGAVMNKRRMHIPSAIYRML